jgi:UDP-N-acetylmuramate--alanine ligase
MIGFNKNRIFFIGIGGIGMSALARWFNAHEFTVVGYDKTSTVLTKTLESEGISIHYNDQVAEIPADFDVESTLVIYTPAVPKNHNQLNYFQNNGFEIKKRAAVLGIISSSFYSIGIAGTHGKTTTSTMLAHILNHAGLDTTAFLGGISANFNSNLLLGKTEKAVAVIEADEYDRSFLQLTPDIEVITSADPDHLDIYGDEAGMLASYKAYTERLKENGKCFVAVKAQQKLSVKDAITYGSGGEIQTENLRIEGNRFYIDFVQGSHRINNIQLNLPGDHNTENALVAIAVASSLGITDDAIKAAMIDFKGIKRRFEYIIDEANFRFIDDYAHHPEEVAAFVKTLRKLYPEKYIEVIFQPHLFSRTQDFAAEFASSLSLADSVILMDIYPAREEPIPGVTSRLIYDLVTAEKKQLLGREVIAEIVAKHRPEVLATVGAGNIDTLVPELKESLTKTLVA